MELTHTRYLLHILSSPSSNIRLMEFPLSTFCKSMEPIGDVETFSFLYYPRSFLNFNVVYYHIFFPAGLPFVHQARTWVECLSTALWILLKGTCHQSPSLSPLPLVFNVQFHHRLVNLVQQRIYFKVCPCRTGNQKHDTIWGSCWKNILYALILACLHVQPVAITESNSHANVIQTKINW